MSLLQKALEEARQASLAKLPEADLVRRQAAMRTWSFVASELSQGFRQVGFEARVGPGARVHRQGALVRLDQRFRRGFKATCEGFAELHGDGFDEARCAPPAELERADEACALDAVARPPRRRGAVILRHEATQELFDVAQRDASAGPPGKPEEGRFLHRYELEPHPFQAFLAKGFLPWRGR